MLKKRRKKRTQAGFKSIPQGVCAHPDMCARWQNCTSDQCTQGLNDVDKRANKQIDHLASTEICTFDQMCRV